MLSPGRVLSVLTFLLAFAAACASSARETASGSSSCDGRTMAIIVNLSSEAVEAVAVREGTERILALAPPGLASRPFQSPRPEERDFARPEERRLFYWYLRDVATRRQIPSRDPKVKTNWVCVEESDAR